MAERQLMKSVLHVTLDARIAINISTASETVQGVMEPTFLTTRMKVIVRTCSVFQYVQQALVRHHHVLFQEIHELLPTISVKLLKAAQLEPVLMELTYQGPMLMKEVSPHLEHLLKRYILHLATRQSIAVSTLKVIL
jgi:hypothetical protein